MRRADEVREGPPDVSESGGGGNGIRAEWGLGGIYPPGNGCISHLWKRKIIFKKALGAGYVGSQECRCFFSSKF